MNHGWATLCELFNPVRIFKLNTYNPWANFYAVGLQNRTKIATAAQTTIPETETENQQQSKRDQQILTSATKPQRSAFLSRFHLLPPTDIPLHSTAYSTPHSTPLQWLCNYKKAAG